MAGDDTKFSSQSLDRRSFNDTYGMYENIAYGTDGTNVLALAENIGAWDKVTQTQAALTDSWAFEVNAVPTKTVLITYTDAGKGTISTVEIS